MLRYDACLHVLELLESHVEVYMYSFISFKFKLFPPVDQDFFQIPLNLAFCLLYILM